MRTLHVGLRVADLDRTLAFYTAVGYEVIGQVPETAFGRLTMIQLPGDAFVTIELVDDPTGGGDGIGDGRRLNHLVIQVDSLDETTELLTGRGIAVEDMSFPDEDDRDFRTTWITDPDGNRIELVQWAPGHADGITAADWEA